MKEQRTKNEINSNIVLPALYRACCDCSATHADISGAET